MYVFIVCVLIDTWWNVNNTPDMRQITATTVLIDTWWNVNISPNVKLVDADTVLIDTWWNVNQEKTEKGSVKKSCFNRYMVECEFKKRKRYTIKK